MWDVPSRLWWMNPSQRTCLQMFTLTRCHRWWICLCASLHYGQTLTNQIAPLIVSLIGGLIIIRPAWWEVNILQLCRRRRDNKDEPAAAVVLLLMVCLERRTMPTPASIRLQQVCRNNQHRPEFSGLAHDFGLFLQCVCVCRPPHTVYSQINQSASTRLANASRC